MIPITEEPGPVPPEKPVSDERRRFLGDSTLDSLVETFAFALGAGLGTAIRFTGLTSKRLGQHRQNRRRRLKG